MAEGESKVKQVLSILWSYLYSSLPPTEDFIIQLEIGGLIARNDARKLCASARLGSTSCIHDLITYMYQFFDEPAFETFCTILDKYGRSARPLLLEVAARIREEIGLKLPQVHEPVPEDPQKGTSKPRADVAHGTSSADMSQHDVYYPVIDDLKPSFSNLAGNVLSTIDLLSSKNLKAFCTNFLLNHLKPSFPPDAPLPVIPKTVEDLKPFLASRWDPLQIDLLKAVVERLASRKIQGGNFKATVKKVKYELNAYEDLLKRKLPEFLSECRSESVSLKSYPGQSSVSAKIASTPAEISLSRIMKLRGFFIRDLDFRYTLFTGFSEGCIVLFFSIPTECVWSLPSCLHPSNLSQLEEWKVLFLSVEGAFTVDIKERRVIDSLDKPRLQPALKSVLQPYGPSNVAGSETQRQARTGDVMAQCGNPSRYAATKPTERYLKVVADRAGRNWNRLLTSLDIPWATIEKLSADSPDRWETCMKGLLLWLNGVVSHDSSEPVTFGTLFAALKDSGMADCVSLLVDRLDERSTPHPRPTHEDKDEDPSTPPSERREEEIDTVTLLQEKDTKLQEKDTQIAKLLEEIQRLEQENNQQEKDTQHLDPAKLLNSRPKTGTPDTEMGTPLQLTQPGEAEVQHVDYSTAQAVTMEKGESKVNQVLSTLWSYLYSSLPLNEDFIIQLQIGGILARNDATRLRASARLGGRACIHDLISFMYDFFDEPALEAFCTFLDKYGQPTRPLMLEVAAKIREEIRLKLHQIHVRIPEDPQKGTTRANVEKEKYHVESEDTELSANRNAVEKNSLDGDLETSLARYEEALYEEVENKETKKPPKPKSTLAYTTNLRSLVADTFFGLVNKPKKTRTASATPRPPLYALVDTSKKTKETKKPKIEAPADQNELMFAALDFSKAPSGFQNRYPLDFKKPAPPKPDELQ